jgi:hypothetical protein
MLGRIFLVAVLLGTLVTLRPLAFAYPPDPLWIPGIYDDDDNDNAIDLASSGTQGATTAWVEIDRPPLIAAGGVLLWAPTGAAGPVRSSVQVRAPPIF